MMIFKSFFTNFKRDLKSIKTKSKKPMPLSIKSLILSLIIIAIEVVAAIVFLLIVLISDDFAQLWAYIPIVYIIIFFVLFVCFMHYAKKRTLNNKEVGLCIMLSILGILTIISGIILTVASINGKINKIQR
ncbi:MAG: hypothetical protein ACRAS9_01945 [Mycoplasma sp.]